MRIINKFSVAFIFLTVLCATAYAGESVNVGIDYGNARQSRGVEAEWEEGVTALEVLQSIAKVEIHLVGKQ